MLLRVDGIFSKLIPYSTFRTICIYGWLILLISSLFNRFLRLRVEILGKASSAKRTPLAPPPLLLAVIAYASETYILGRFFRHIGRYTRQRSGPDPELSNSVDDYKKSGGRIFERLDAMISQTPSSPFMAICVNLCLLGLCLAEVVVNMTFKLLVIAKAIVYLIMNREKSGFQQAIEAKREKHNRLFLSSDDRAVLVSRRTVVFIRHGESMWNYLFNREIGIKMIFRALVLICREIWLFGEYDSVLLDSPLSAVGITQSAHLRSWFNANATATDKQNQKLLTATTAPYVSKLYSILKGLDPNIKITLATSNLRRAISTLAIALQDRLNQFPDEQVYSLSYLQEITDNPDARTLALPKSHAQPSSFEKEVLTINMESFYNDRLNSVSMLGNKKLSDKVANRLEGFAEWLFSPSSPCGDNSSDHLIVAAGHSMFIMMFCDYFMPPGFDVPIQKRKISNCACLKLVVCEYRVSGKIFFTPYHHTSGIRAPLGSIALMCNTRRFVTNARKSTLVTL